MNNIKLTLYFEVVCKFLSELFFMHDFTAKIKGFLYWIFEY